MVVYIKNIIFDLGGVILEGRSVSILDDMNLDKETYDKLKQFFYYRKELDMGEMTLEEAFDSCNFSKELESLYKDKLLNYYKYRKINMRLINMIRKLKNNNYNVYVLSDNIKEIIDYLKSNELFKDIDGWVVSCDYKTIKKEGKLFDIILDKYNLEPSTCYFIDDNIDNVNVAISKGIKGFLFDDNIDSLIENMKNNNIEIEG